MSRHKRQRSLWASAGAASITLTLCLGIAAAWRVTTAAAPDPVQAPDTVQDLGLTAEGLGASPREQAEVRAFYAQRAQTLAWDAPDGALSRQALALLERLHDADAQGLSSRDYGLPAVVEARTWPATTAMRRARDVALTLVALRYIRHLHLGRVDPRTLGLRIATWSEAHDFPRLLADAVAADRVPGAIDDLAPPFVLYRRLGEALRRYRGLAAGGDLPLVPAVRRSVRPEEAYGDGDVLAARLVQLGDLTASDPLPPAGRYTGVLVIGVQRFQSRHGLTADGVLGARTVAALRVPVAQRVQQIVLAMERLRWLPDLGRRRVIAVNIPMFRLWAWDALKVSAEPTLSLEVIVGKAVRKTRTPVFVETMEQVIFRPYWNVPKSILLDEVLPTVARQPGYLAREQMEIVAGPGDDARMVPVTPDALERLRMGELRLRQRPGPRNALGLVKFVFPNDESVYMHGTPAVGLFARDRRDFSHGCIRVSDPPALAAWVLAGVAGWDVDHIAAAMAGEETSRGVPLAEPIDVVLYYVTAAVLPEDGQVHFAEDIYGHDATLARALARRDARQ